MSVVPVVRLCGSDLRSVWKVYRGHLTTEVPLNGPVSMVTPSQAELRLSTHSSVTGTHPASWLLPVTPLSASMLSDSLLTALLHPYTHARAHCTHPIITTPSRADAAAPQSPLSQHAPARTSSASITFPTWRSLFFALHLPVGSVRLGIPAASRLLSAVTTGLSEIKRRQIDSSSVAFSSSLRLLRTLRRVPSPELRALLSLSFSHCLCLSLSVSRSLLQPE